MTAFPPVLADLAKHGWAQHVTAGVDADAVVGELDRFSSLLGTRIEGRAGALLEVIRPQTVEEAHPRSLSARYGLSALPFHIELSHRPRPCRYVLLGCIEPGQRTTVTMLLDWRTLGFAPEELRLLEDAPILVRTGRRSFYSTMLSSDRGFLRYDPGCLEAIDDRGQAALQLVERRLAEAVPELHYWRRGDILIIDNWRVLHGRGPSEQGSGRRLARVLIDA
ncbi:TauD/TfdA family dioxygenase [Achromobacter kerstersii]|uniref:TauD/TfdA family dioxygenase n=1 Tax=Achromobacter kerstersii TaxID=1353890 RepID=UPI0006BFBAE3|nr:TauD/TfdA family dioxygenase [Achromobacter kerstersii]CUJ49197.1 Taurine catabolism dioxygenase TauD%2C TfdA family [Achromobacter kerstersii]